MLNSQDGQKVDVMEIKCLKNIRSVRRIDGVRSEIIRGKYGTKLSLLEMAKIKMV